MIIILNIGDSVGRLYKGYIFTGEVFELNEIIRPLAERRVKRANDILLLYM